MPTERHARACTKAWMFAALNSVEQFAQMFTELDLFEAAQEWAKLRRPMMLAATTARLSKLAQWLDDREYLEGPLHGGGSSNDDGAPDTASFGPCNQELHVARVPAAMRGASRLSKGSKGSHGIICGERSCVTDRALRTGSKSPALSRAAVQITASPHCIRQMGLG